MCIYMRPCMDVDTCRGLTTAAVLRTTGVDLVFTSGFRQMEPLLAVSWLAMSTLV